MHSRAIRVISPGLEPGTTSVLDWCDNQLHHETKLVNRLLSCILSAIFLGGGSVEAGNSVCMQRRAGPGA